MIRSLPTRLVSEVTGADRRSVERWRSGVTPSRTAFVRRLDDLAAIVDLLGPAMSARGKAAWLTARSPFLGWQRPVDVLAAGEFDRARDAARAYAAGDVT